MNRWRAHGLVLAGVLLSCGTNVATQAIMTVHADEAPSQAAVAPEATGKLLVVDLQAAVRDTRDGIAAGEQLAKVQAVKQKQLDDQRAVLEKENAALQDAAKQSSPGKLQARLAKYQQRVAELQYQFTAFQREMQEEERKLLEPISKRLLQHVKAIARKVGADVVLDKAAVPVVRNGLDATAAVVASYDSAP